MEPKAPPTLCSRLNKIGRDPHLVSDRATLEADWRQMTALLNSLSSPTSPAPAIDNLSDLVR